VISPQFGQENFVASWPGEIIRLQLVHTGIFNAALVDSFADANVNSPLIDEGLNISYGDLYLLSFPPISMENLLFIKQ
jgi:hypothetical protein